MEKNDRVIRKVVGKLIEVLHGEYSDTRDLAVVQLTLLGRKAVPFILSFLKKEGDLERDFISFHEIRERIDRSGYGVSVDGQTFEDWKREKEKFCQDFERKWGWKISDQDLPSRSIGEIGHIPQRQEAVDGALEALAIIGDPKAIPTLKSLPMYDWQTSDLMHGRRHTRTFEKAKETIDKIQST